MFIIYRHSANNKSYIGYTKHSIVKRFQNHVAYANKGSKFLFHKAIRKYGKECWTNEVLATCETVSEARELEKKFIAEFGTNIRGNGYNMTVGGEGNANAGVPLKPEHKAKAVAALRSYHWTPELYKERALKKVGVRVSSEGRKAISDGIRKQKSQGLTEAQKLQLHNLHTRNKK